MLGFYAVPSLVESLKISCATNVCVLMCNEQFNVVSQLLLNEVEQFKGPTEAEYVSSLTNLLALVA